MAPTLGSVDLRTRKQWRAWLAKHHASSPGVWLVRHKRHTGVESMSLDELQRTAAAYRPEIDVLRARLLESHGLWDEAEAVWTGLSILYPGRDELLHQALRLRAKSLARPDG